MYAYAGEEADAAPKQSRMTSNATTNPAKKRRWGREERVILIVLRRR
jgi:hypothetical protein